MKKTLTRLVSMVCITTALFGLGYKEGSRQRELASQNKTLEKMNAYEIVSAIGTFDEAKNYLLNNFSYEDHEGFRSFEEIHKTKRGLCRDAAWAALVLLSDDEDRYDVTLMDIRPKNTEKGGHAVALVQDIKTKKFGSLGINDTDCIKPEYNSVKEVFDQINTAFSFRYNEESCNFLVFEKGKTRPIEKRYLIQENKFKD